MPPRRTYSNELRAQVIAEWQLGASLHSLSVKHDIPMSTVKGWLDRVERTVAVPQKDQREELGRLVYDYLAAGLEALIAQARAMADPEWFKGQGGSHHLIHGVLADKLVIIFGGVERGKPADDADDD